jgi:hypothetical protein
VPLRSKYKVLASLVCFNAGVSTLTPFFRNIIMARLALLTAFLAAASLSTARTTSFVERQVPANATGVTTITSPQGAQIRFKQPGKQGVCETTQGVDDYAGYISLNEKTNM